MRIKSIARRTFVSVTERARARGFELVVAILEFSSPTSNERFILDIASAYEKMCPMIYLRPSLERGFFDHGWLRSFHSFSFAEYYDPAHMGFSALRVINEDHIAEGQGFGTHPHKDMEIVTYVLEGALEHKDSMGHQEVLKPGEVQYMCAGTGVRHSEYNPSKTEACHLLQIWILPDRGGHKPEYQQKDFSKAISSAQKTLVVSNDGRDGSLSIHQDANIYVIKAKKGESVELPNLSGRAGWLQLIEGDFNLPGDYLGFRKKEKLSALALSAGDALAIADEAKSLKIEAKSNIHLLYFDLPLA